MRNFVHPFLRLLCSTAITLAVAAPTFAQDAATPAAAPVGLTPAEGADDVVGRLAFSDTALDSVLQTLETLTGRIVIRPQALPSPQLSLNAKQTLTRAEAILAIESLLSINGIGVTPLGDKFLKVVPIANIRTEAPELVVGSLKDVPPSGKVVSKLFRLQYLDSATFQQQAAQFVSGFATIVPFQNSNAVIVTDTIANLQRLEYVVSEVDRRLEIETKFYQIHYANAVELGEQIQSMIESARSSLAGQNAGQRGGQTRPQPEQGPQPPSPAAGAASAAGGVPLQVIVTSNTAITSDERTNQLIVITNPSNLPFFDNLIEKLDVAADPPTDIEVFPMKHADAVELASLLSQLISGQSQAARSGGDRDSSLRQRGTPFPQLQDQTSGRLPQDQRRQAVQEAVQSTMEEADQQFSELMTVIADERTNSIVASGTNSDLVMLTELVDKLDVVLAQVRIEVVIAEVTLNDGTDRGFDTFGISYDSVTGLGSVTIPTGGSFSGTLAGTLVGSSLTDWSIEAVLGVARSKSNVNLLSVPTIVTTHNKEASIIVGEARPIVTSTQTSLSQVGGTYASFQFQDIGIELMVKPIIGPNDVIQLEIDQKVDDISGTITIDQNEQPIIARRQATSYLTVKDNQLVVLGGLQRNFINKTKSRMFILGEIPGIGELFSRTQNDLTKTEILIFLKPTVLRDTSEADENARESVRRFNPSEEDARTLQELTGENMTRAIEGIPPETPETTQTKVRRPAQHRR